MGRTGFVVQRLLLLIPVAVGVTIIVFFMVHLIPGDPAATILGIHATPKAVALLHQQWGLNRPLASQYWLFLDRLLHGNLGQSIFYGGSVSSLILSHLPPTLWLLAYATVLTVVISVPTWCISASPKPRVVTAGEPRRSPLVTIGGRGSRGMALRLTVICTSSSSIWARATMSGCGLASGAKAASARSPAMCWADFI